jgi:small neutral amino acid transporter SnatA (MarC family)
MAIVRAGGGSDDAARDETPASWLWALVLLLALNPVRAAFGIPRRDAGAPAVEGYAPRPPRGSAAELALLGGAAGALLVVAASALGPPLLDAVNVSDSAFRVAAGIVALVAGVWDLSRRPPRPEPALSGRLAALVPVAVPLVARPALLILALGAGADRGVLPSVLAMAVGVGALAGLVATEPAGRGRDRTLRWIARLLGAGLIAGGVALGLAGIMDV